MAAFAERIDNRSKSGTISNWETGKNLPNNERLKRIAEIGDTTVEYLLKDNQAKTLEEAVDEIKENFNADEIKQIIRQLI